MPVIFKCTREPVNCDNLIDRDFDDSGDDTGDEYESD